MSIASTYKRMRSEMTEWLSIWQEVSDNYNVLSYDIAAEGSKKKMRRMAIPDNTAIMSVNTLVSGLQAGVTPVSSKWFKLSYGGKQFGESREISDFEDYLDRLISLSNTYSIMPEVYRDLVLYGVACVFVREDAREIFRLERQPVGSYVVGFAHSGAADYIGRRFVMRAAEAKAMFAGMDDSIADNQIVEIYNAVERKNELWTSKYEYKGEVIAEYKYEYRPFMVVRWGLTNSTDYAVSPAMNALGDVKQLQVEQLRKARAIDHQSNPAIQIPVSMRNSELNFKPGGISYYTNTDEQIRPASIVNVQLNYLLQDIEDVRQRIRSALFYDVFMMVSGIGHTGMTATEIMERRNEKLTVIGSVVDRLQDDLIEPFLMSVISMLVSNSRTRNNVPGSLIGGNFTVSPVGTLYQSRIEANNNSINRFIGQLTTLAQINPEAIRRLDIDKTIEQMAKNSGINMSIIKTKEEVEEEIAAEQERAMAEKAADAALANPQAFMGQPQPQTNVDASGVVNSLDVMGAFE